MSKIKYIAAFLIFLVLFSSIGWAKSYSYYAVIAERNIFRPLASMQNGNKTDEVELRKAMLEEEKRQAELKKEEERRQLENKKRELENSFSLTGVVFNGKKLSALISDRQTSQGNAYGEGDLLRGAKIVAIDEKMQTVELDYEGKFKVTLKIK